MIGHLSFTGTIDAYHALSTPRSALLIDPDGLILNDVTVSVKTKRLLVLSQNSSNLDVARSSAMCDGNTIVLLDADCLHPFVAPLLAICLSSQDSNASKEIRIGSRIATWDPRFTLVLIWSVADRGKLPAALLCRVAVVDCSSSAIETAKMFLENTFLEFFDPAVPAKGTVMRKTELTRRVRIERYERDILDTLAEIVATPAANSAYDYLADQDTLQDLVRSKEAYSHGYIFSDR
jgi:hypothetical protein